MLSGRFGGISCWLAKISCHYHVNLNYREDSAVQPTRDTYHSLCVTTHSLIILSSCLPPFPHLLCGNYFFVLKYKLLKLEKLRTHSKLDISQGKKFGLISVFSVNVSSIALLNNLICLIKTGWIIGEEEKNNALRKFNFWEDKLQMIAHWSLKTGSKSKVVRQTV